MKIDVRFLGHAGLGLLLAAGLPSCARVADGVPVLSGANPPHVEWVSDPENKSDTLIAVTLSGSGPFHVGADFPPGVYQSNGSTGRSPCTWLRLSDGGGVERTVESGSGQGRQRVEIDPTDMTFVTSSCLPWRKVA